MPRHETIYTVTDEGRDKGKVFKIIEMDCAEAEQLAWRALFLLEKAGGLPEGVDVTGMGVLGVAAAGFKAFCQFCSYDDIKPIMDEMWKCIDFIPNPHNHNVTHKVLPNEIEEVMTRIKLRMEVFQLHVGFPMGGEDSKSTPTTETPRPPISKTTSTSPARSAQSSALGKRR